MHAAGLRCNRCWLLVSAILSCLLRVRVQPTNRSLVLCLSRFGKHTCVLCVCELQITMQDARLLCASTRAPRA
jgi:hypothetical protein